MIKGKVLNPDSKEYEDFLIDDEFATESQNIFVTGSIRTSVGKGPGAGDPFLILLEQIKELEKDGLIKDLAWEDNNDDPPDTIY